MNKFKNISIPYVLIDKYKEFNLSETEVLTLMKIISFNEEDVDLAMLTQSMGISRSIIVNLESKGFISMKEDEKAIVVNCNNTYELIYGKTTQNTGKQRVSTVVGRENIDRINILLGRAIKPHEIEIVNVWISDNYSLEEIELAIQKSVANDVDNFKYMEAILKNSKKMSDSTFTIERNLELY